MNLYKFHVNTDSYEVYTGFIIAAEKLEADRGELTDAGNWALGYWRGQKSILEALLEEIENEDKGLKI